MSNDKYGVTEEAIEDVVDYVHGIVADAYGALEAGFWITAIAMAASGLWVALRLAETLARVNPGKP